MDTAGSDNRLCRFWLYQTLSKVYLVASDKSSECWRLLKFDKHPDPANLGELDVTEDPATYTKPQCSALLKKLNDGNLQHGGLQLVCQAYGILGCFRFMEGFYLLLVTKKKYEGTLCGHKIYAPEATALVPLVSSASHRAFSRDKAAAAAEQRYRRLLSGVSLNDDFYFSYTLPLWLTVQRGFGSGVGVGAAGAGPEVWAPFASDRVWNEYLTRPLREALGHDRWVLPLVHGFFQQRRLALFGRTLTLTLIARRSRQFAGTRYRKRGVNDAGYVANDVETEQVVEAGLDWRTGQPLISSMVQVRGSIPLYWGQSSEVGRLKPEITLQRFDPLFTATKKHFDDLRQRYGNPIVVLNLVKLVERHPRESLLGQELAAAVAHLNRQTLPGERVQYVPWDLSRHAKADSRHLLHHLQRLLAPLLRATGLFVSGASGGGGGSQQVGIVRTNCVDCLDRTNVAQFAAGLLGLGRQLHALGISESAHLDPDSSLARQLMDMYEGMGNSVALQYGGSEAHTAFFQRQRGDWEAATQSRDVLTSLRRFYSNAYTDAEKQDAINLLLGNFVPQPGRPHLWELGSDYYLHAGRGVAGLARHLFLGGAAGAASGQGRAHGQGHCATSPSLPPSREGSYRGGSLPALPAGGLPSVALPEGEGSGGGGMVSLSVPIEAARAAGLVPVGSGGLGGITAAAAAQSEGGGVALESTSGSESGRETPSPGRGELAVGAGLHLSVSTDGAEVPTLSQLVEGASPSWRPSVSAESSLESLSLDEGAPQDEAALDVLGEYVLVAAAAAGMEEAAAAVTAGAGEGTWAAAVGEAPGAAEAQQQQEEAEEEEEEERHQGVGEAQAPAAPVPAQVAPLGEGGGKAAQWQRPAPVLIASPAGEPEAAEPAGDQQPRTPTTSSAPTSATVTPQGTPGGTARQRPPPAQPRRTKLESFDKLISKPPNAVRQVRLTAVPAAPPRGSSLTAWLPSPSRPKPLSLPPAAVQEQQQQQQSSGPSLGSSLGRTSVPASQLGRPAAVPGAAVAVCSAQQQASVAAALSRMSATPTAPMGLGGAGGGPRLFRSSSDSTLLATISESVEWAGGLSGPSPATAIANLGPGLAPGRQAAMQPTPSAVAGVSPAGALPQSASASTFDLSRYSREAGWGGGGRPPPVAPTGYLVVLDAWEGQGQGGTRQATTSEDSSDGAPGLSRPGSTEPPSGSKPPRKSRFPGFSLSQGLKAFSRSKSQQAILSSSSSDPALSPQQLQRSSAPAAPAVAAPTPGATAAGLPPAWAAMYAGAPSALPVDTSAGVASLGLPPRTSAAWWVGGADPVALMLEEEARLREQYTRQLRALATPPTPAEQQALEQQLTALTRPSWSLSMSGQSGQAAQQWRQQAGLMGAPTLGQFQLASLAQQAEAAATQHGLAF